MPSSQDFLTVGHLYRGIGAGLDHLAQKIGEGEFFCGSVDHQVSPAIASLPGVPGRAMAENPIMRTPPSDATNRVFTDQPMAGTRPAPNEVN
jgi:hypothetical protein